MKNKLYFFLTILIILGGFSVASIHDFNNSKAGKRAEEFLTSMAESSHQALKKFADNTLDKSFHSLFKKGKLIPFLVDTAKDLEGYTYQKLYVKQLYKIAFFVHATGKSPMGVIIKVSPAPPHKIVGWLIDDNVSRVKKYGMKDQKTWLGKVKKRLSMAAEADKFSGVVTVLKSGKPIFEFSAGMAHKGFKIPMSKKTRFNVASVGKMFTTVAIGQLIDQKKLSWDTPVGEILPEFPNQQIKKVTIKELLNHTSGISNYMTEPFWKTNPREIKDFHQLIPFFSSRNLKHQPGEQYLYSNSAYIILGLIIEEISGKSYFDYIRDFLFSPLNMKNSDFVRLEDVVDNFAEGYSKRTYYYKNGIMLADEHPKAPWHRSASLQIKGGPSGGVITNATDLAVFIKALTQGKLLKPITIKKMTTLNTHRTIKFKEIKGFGRGFAVRNLYGHHFWGHGGDLPGYSAEAAYFPESEYVIIVLANYDAVAHSIYNEIVKFMPKRQN